MQKLHKSWHIGFALDFAQHRQYVHGDDVKRIDWRVYAKADRYYIIKYEVTTNLQAYIVVDASWSMRLHRGGCGGAAHGLSKFRYAYFLATCLSLSWCCGSRIRRDLRDVWRPDSGLNPAQREYAPDDHRGGVAGANPGGRGRAFSPADPA